MDIDKNAIGRMPNKAYAPFEWEGTDDDPRGGGARAEARSLCQLNTPYSPVGLVNDIAGNTTFTVEQVRKRLDAAILQAVEGMLKEGAE